MIYFLGFFSELNEVTRVVSLGFVYGLFPIAILVVAVMLIINTKIMNTKEGVKLASFLSLIIGLNMIIVMGFTYILVAYGHLLNKYVHIVMLIMLLCSLYFGFLFVSYLAYSYLYQKLPVKKSVDYIIVLGSGLIGDRVPPLLKSRLDKGIQVYKNQMEKGCKSKIIVSGGQGPDELVSEASAMKKYLISQNINSKDILVEDKSTTTYENMKFSKVIMDNSKSYRCVFVTNNYHVFRASIYARKVGLKANGVGAPTAFYFLPNALIREFIAILVLNKKVNIFVVLAIVAFVVISSI